MLKQLKHYFLMWNTKRSIKASIRLATEAIYSEQFDVGAIVKRLSNDTGGINLLQAYISVSLAAGLTEPLKEADIDHALMQLQNAEQHLDTPEFDGILTMTKKLAVGNWSQRRADILRGKQACTNDEYSYAGMIYRLENAKRGPCSLDERNETKNHHDELTQAKRNLEDYLAKTAEIDCKTQEKERQVKEELDSVRHELELLDDPATINIFGQMSLDGDEVPQDYVAAANWFRIAAEQAMQTRGTIWP